MKDSENETVADVVKELRADANAVLDDQHDEDCWSNIEASEIYRSLADRIETAHRREVDSLNFRLMTAKSEQKTAANVIIEQTNKVEKLEREVAELQRRLKVAEEALTLCISGMCGGCHRQNPDGTCICPNGCYEMTIAKNALAAIREEGRSE